MRSTPDTFPSPRTKISGIDAVQAALRGESNHGPVQLLLLPRNGGPAEQALAETAAAQGIPIWYGGAGDLRRMSPDSSAPTTALALLGASPHASMPALLDRAGLCWLLHEPAYPSNVGFIIRTAEVSGADGVIIDAPTFNREARSRASHVSMGADRVMPVLWTSTDHVLEQATRRGTRIIALEDSGQRAPHQVDLTEPVVLVVGNERHGIPHWLREQCADVVRIPMLGFVPSYSVQAAVAALSWERLRQLASAHLEPLAVGR